MKAGYLLGAVLAAVAVYGFVARPRSSVAPSASISTEQRVLPEGNPAVGSNGNASDVEESGIPAALLAEPSGALPAGHPRVDKSVNMPVAGERAMPAGHPGTASPPDETLVPKLARAKGSNGYAIAEIFSKKQSLAGKRVRVRGMVTKVTLDVLGKTFLHIRDGSGAPDTQNNDLAVTTSARPAKGDVLLLEGTLTPDKDLGIGYKYPVLFEDAISVTE
jgi:hypothetical protein